MKILHIVNTYAPVGGIETYILDLLPLLAKRGHENALIYRQAHARTPQTLDSSIHHVPVTTDPAGDRQKIAELIERERPSLIYLHDVYDSGVMELAAQLAPTVGYVHIFYPVCPGLGKLYKRGDQICERAYGTGCIPQIYLRRCASARHPRSVARIMRNTRRYLEAYRKLTRVTVASRYMRDLMVQNGIAADKIDVLPYFVPIPDSLDDGPAGNFGNSDSRYTVRTVSGIGIPDTNSKGSFGNSNSRSNILFAGRLEYEKGAPYLLRAARRINAPFTLQIAGDGSLRSDYMALAQELGIADRVTFTQWLAPDELQAAYRRSVVTVMPTIMAEPFGKVGVEAMANGRPVVAFNVGGIPDWLIDGYNGFLVPPRDEKQLAARLEQVLLDAELADEMGRNGRVYVKENYTQDKHLDRLIAIFEKVVETGD